MFQKLVAIEPVSLVESAKEELNSFAKEVVFYQDIPTGDDEVAARIDDADAVLVSHTSRINKAALKKCPNIIYIGMCCSLYSPESANVDIRYANERGITVTGVRDYGDHGAVEYVVSELIRCLHGFGRTPWYGAPREIGGVRVGILGLGKLGGMIADALSFLGAEVAYFARSEKEEAKSKGYQFLSLNELLVQSEVLCCCLNKNTILLGDAEFRLFGNKKILFNTGLSPAWEETPWLKWLEEDNLCFCDSLGALGGEHLLTHQHIECAGVYSGVTVQAYERLSRKVIANLAEYSKSKIE